MQLSPLHAKLSGLAPVQVACRVAAARGVRLLHNPASGSSSTSQRSRRVCAAGESISDNIDANGSDERVQAAVRDQFDVDADAAEALDVELPAREDDVLPDSLAGAVADVRQCEFSAALVACRLGMVFVCGAMPHPPPAPRVPISTIPGRGRDCTRNQQRCHALSGRNPASRVLGCVNGCKATINRPMTVLP